MHDGYMTLETRFYANFNERILEREKVERAAKGKVIWLDEKMDVISFKILDNREKPYVRDLISNKDFGCIVISIMREDGKIINLPKAWTSIYDGDVLTVVGSIEGIEAYSHMLGNDKNIKAGDTTPINLKEYLYSQLFDEEKTKEDQLMCCALKPIKKSDFLYKKAIKDSEFIPKYDGYILAIERDGLLMISPNKNLVIKENDIVWCIGTQEMVDRLEQEGVLAL